MPDARPHFVFTEPYAPEAIARAQAVGRVTLLEACDEAALLNAVGEAEALLIRTRTRVTRSVLERAERLRVIGRGGSGLDNVDIEAAQERGIVVVHTPDAATDAVADLTVGMILALLRHISESDRAVRVGAFEAMRSRRLGRELGAITLGVIGMGRIGKAVAKRCALGFGTRILYNDLIDVGPLGFAAVSLSKPELYAGADVVTLHVPLTDLTRGLIDREALARFKQGAYLINTSRGAVIDARAVADALSQGRLAGAALDVFDPEPPPSDHPLLTAPNTILTPHIGARTETAQARMNEVVDRVIGVLRGDPPDEQGT